MVIFFPTRLATFIFSPYMLFWNTFPSVFGQLSGVLLALAGGAAAGGRQCPWQGGGMFARAIVSGFRLEIGFILRVVLL